MRLHKRLQKTMAVVALAATTMTAMPVFANDYKGHWAEVAIEKWSQEGVVEGYEDGSFKPKKAVTRAELAAIISRVFGLESTNGAKSYSDVSLTKWYTNAIKLVSAAGIMNDNGEMFRPDAPATREEAAYAIANAYHVTGGSNVEFKDADKISEWAVDEIAALVAGGYINGRPDGTFAPADTLTRADLVVMIDKITAEFINEAGTVSKNVKGNVVVNTKDVVLKDMTIDGNLYIAEGVADGNVELNNVKVTGSVIVEGGGMNSVKVLGKSEIPTIVVDKANDKVRLEVGKDATVALVELVSGAKLDGTYANVVVKTTAPITVGEKAKIEKMAVAPEAKGVKIDLASGSEIKTLEVQAELKVTGKGKIKLTIVVDGVDAKKVSIPTSICDKVVASDGKEVEITRPSTGGGGGGGGTGGSTTPDTKKVDIDTITVNGNKTIKFKDNSIVAEYKDNKVTINGVEFTGLDNLETISATGNLATGTKVTVGAVGTDKYAQEFEVGKEYTSKEAIVIMNNNISRVEGLIKENAQAAGLTKDEAAKVEYYFTAAKNALNEYADGGVVSGEAILYRISQVKNKLQDEDVVAGWNKIQPHIQDELKLLGITIDGIGTANVRVSGDILIKATGYDEPDRITITVKF